MSLVLARLTTCSLRLHALYRFGNKVLIKLWPWNTNETQFLKNGRVPFYRFVLYTLYVATPWGTLPKKKTLKGEVEKTNKWLFQLFNMYFCNTGIPGNIQSMEGDAISTSVFLVEMAFPDLFREPVLARLKPSNYMIYKSYNGISLIFSILSITFKVWWTLLISRLFKWDTLQLTISPHCTYLTDGTNNIGYFEFLLLKDEHRMQRWALPPFELRCFLINKSKVSIVAALFINVVVYFGSTATKVNNNFGSCVAVLRICFCWKTKTNPHQCGGMYTTLCFLMSHDQHVSHPAG